MTWGKSYILLRLGRCPLALQSLRAESEADAELMLLYNGENHLGRF